MDKLYEVWRNGEAIFTGTAIEVYDFVNDLEAKGIRDFGVF